MKPHGLRGEVVVELLTNRLERLSPGTTLVVGEPGPAQGPGRAGRATGPEAPVAHVVVTGSRPHGRRHLVRLVSVDGVEAAEALRGRVLLAPPLEDPSALFVHDLIGAEVVERSGKGHGRVAAVEANPASDLLVLEGGGLVPLVFVVGREDGRIVIDPPAGLLE